MINTVSNVNATLGTRGTHVGGAYCGNTDVLSTLMRPEQHSQDGNGSGRGRSSGKGNGKGGENFISQFNFSL